jgi:VWFA-related protein
MLAPAPASSAPEEPPRFPAQAEIVTVDVVVRDRDGKPVPGLTRDDFVVKEDGRTQTITAFEEVDAAVPFLFSPVARGSRVATNVSPPPTRRTFAIVFDDVHVGDLNLERAKRAVEEFASRQVVAGDRLALFTVSDGRYWATTRGAADAAWLDALDGIRSHQRLKSSPACTITHYEANRIEEFADCVVCEMVARRLGALGCTEHGLDCTRVHGNCGSGDSAGAGRPGGPPPRTGPLPNWMPVVETRAIGRPNLDRSLLMLREVARSLAPLPGRKQLVLVTEGFVADPTLAGFRQVREQAARANVAIHFLDARGLSAMPEFLSAAGGRGAVTGRDLALTLALWPLESAGSKALAEETGGRVLQTNDLVAGLAEVVDESRVTYLLGYEPTNTRRDGRYRRLKVEALRPGLEVRARGGYFAEKGKRKNPAPEPSLVERVLGSPFDADGIPLRLAAYVMGEAPLQGPVPKTGIEVLVAGEVRLDAFAIRVKDGRTVAEPKLKLFATSRTRETHESEWSLEVALTPRAEGAAPGEPWHPFLTRIAMGPGDHRARLVVESGGRVGSVTTDFVVPESTEERLSTPILSDQLVAGPGERRVMPIVRRSFPASRTLHAWVELHGAAVDSETGQRRAVAGFVVRSADGREWASGPATPMSFEAGKPARLVSLPLAEAPPGENEIVLTVRDEVSGRSFEAREPFVVGPDDPGPRRDGAE